MRSSARSMPKIIMLKRHKGSEKLSKVSHAILGVGTTDGLEADRLTALAPGLRSASVSLTFFFVCSMGKSHCPIRCGSIVLRWALKLFDHQVRTQLLMALQKGIEKMLHLIWSKDNNSMSDDGKDVKGVHSRLLECYRNLYFDALPDLDPCSISTG
jgi:hypothetical protein